MKQKELNKILENHRHWLNRDCEGWEHLRANLSGENLGGAILDGAMLNGAILDGAMLNGASLDRANLYGASLDGAFLDGAMLNGVNLYRASLDGANQKRKGEKLTETIVGWKKCRHNVIVKLEIPRGAIVFSINGEKCRTDKAKVVDIIGANRAYSQHKYFSYYVGDVIEVYNFDCQYNVECATGIHFFRTREEAEEY